MDASEAKLRLTRGLLAFAGSALLALAACAPQAAAPTAAPAKPAPTTAPAKPAPTAAPAKVEAPAPKPAATAAPAAKPTEPPAAKPAPFDEKAVADFYKGKTVRIIVGFGAGGPYDVFSRLVARYLANYIPGKPNVIIEAKPGAASIVAANAVYATEPKDGTVIGSIGTGLPLQQALGKEGIQYDAAKFNWLGNGNKGFSACAARTELDVRRVEDLTGPNARQLAVATIGPGTGTHDAPAMLSAVLGMNLKLVPGYEGTTKILLALETKEADAYCTSFDMWKSGVRQMLEGSNPALKFFIVMGNQPRDHPWLKGVPPAESLAKTDEARQMLRAVEAAQQIGYPFVVAPDVPRDRVEALRKAMADTFADPQFRADGEKAAFDLNAGTAQETTEVVRSLLNTPPATIAKLKEILK